MKLMRLVETLLTTEFIYKANLDNSTVAPFKCMLKAIAVV
jgi:hypothetical protein